MQRNTAILWWWLGILTKRRFDALMQVFGNLDDVSSQLSIGMLRELGLKQETAEAVVGKVALFNAERYEEQMKKKEVELLTIEDAAFPERLREISDPPVFLSYRGDLSILQQPLISVVGTRAMSKYGQRVVEKFVPAFVRAGAVTVSGLALGIDAKVAEESMKAGGRTVAVLGHGLSTIYPSSNRSLGEKILKNGGLIVSEFPLDFPPDKFTFPSRNRIIAGLSSGTLLCEAPVASGSIITGELALDYNRSVYAVPGSIFDENYAGCHELISNGHAKLVSTPEEVLRDMGMILSQQPASSVYRPSSPDEAAIFTILTGIPLTADELAQRTGLDPSHVATALTMLELEGAVQNIGNGLWIRR